MPTLTAVLLLLLLLLLLLGMVCLPAAAEERLRPSTPRARRPPAPPGWSLIAPCLPLLLLLRVCLCVRLRRAADTFVIQSSVDSARDRRKSENIRSKALAPEPDCHAGRSDSLNGDSQIEGGWRCSHHNNLQSGKREQGHSSRRAGGPYRDVEVRAWHSSFFARLQPRRANTHTTQRKENGKQNHQKTKPTPRAHAAWLVSFAESSPARRHGRVCFSPRPEGGHPRARVTINSSNKFKRPVKIGLSIR
jgi:hypothetical protein